MSQDPTAFALSPQISRDYRILRILGRGGMGEVYLAEQLRVGNRQVALKVLNRSCSQDSDIIRRFENEAAFAGRINHTNVVMVFDSRVTEDGQLYLAMEYVDGKSLKDLINERGRLPLDEIVRITDQICSGLAAAHKLGIVHRDVKPDNIMLTNREEDGALIVKLLDFGISRLSEPTPGASHTMTGTVVGTPHYMSPEQALGQTGENIDARSDIYSLGMVVYEMLAGQRAFESDSWIQVIYKHINERPLPPSQIRPELAGLGDFEGVILKALEKRREDRQQTVGEFAGQLQAAYNRTRIPPGSVPTRQAPHLTGAAWPADSSGPVGFRPATTSAPTGPPGPTGVANSQAITPKASTSGGGLKACLVIAFFALIVIGSVAVWAVINFSGSRQPDSSGGAPTPSPSASPTSGKTAYAPLVAYTPPAGSPVRKAIMDAARVPVEAELKRKVLFKVDQLKVKDTWAFLAGIPLNPDATRPSEEDTEPTSTEADGERVWVLLQSNGGKWDVADYAIGRTDLRHLMWARKYQAPAEIFK